MSLSATNSHLNEWLIKDCQNVPLNFIRSKTLYERWKQSFYVFLSLCFRLVLSFYERFIINVEETNVAATNFHQLFMTFPWFYNCGRFYRNFLVAKPDSLLYNSWCSWLWPLLYRLLFIYLTLLSQSIIWLCVSHNFFFIFNLLRNEKHESSSIKGIISPRFDSLIVIVSDY